MGVNVAAHPRHPFLVSAPGPISHCISALLTLIVSPMSYVIKSTIYDIMIMVLDIGV